ncbi:hypothetical protein C8Q78DRAFT_189602 [Trametes maxima]|nr:hypothetical protein C8Q78DRAFT_189602 [Trametes maxima]
MHRFRYTDYPGLSLIDSKFSASTVHAPFYVTLRTFQRHRSHVGARCPPRPRPVKHAAGAVYCILSLLRLRSSPVSGNTPPSGENAMFPRSYPRVSAPSAPVRPGASRNALRNRIRNPGGGSGLRDCIGIPTLSVSIQACSTQLHKGVGVATAGGMS